jgi:hypothetical protein
MRKDSLRERVLLGDSSSLGKRQVEQIRYRTPAESRGNGSLDKQLTIAERLGSHRRSELAGNKGTELQADLWNREHDLGRGFHQVPAHGFAMEPRCPSNREVLLDEGRGTPRGHAQAMVPDGQRTTRLG